MKRAIKNIVKYGAFTFGFLMFVFVVGGIIFEITGYAPETPVVKEKDTVRKPKPKPTEKKEVVKKSEPKPVEKETPKPKKLSEYDLALKQVTYAVGATRLHKEFSENAIAASAKYKDKLTMVTGQIEELSMVLDVPVVGLQTGQMFQTVDCYMKSELIPYLSKLKKGQHVSIIGKVESEFAGSVTVMDCIIERKSYE